MFYKKVIDRDGYKRNKYKNYEKTSCVNCGDIGHMVKECKKAITSFGIIAFKYCLTKEDENGDLNYQLHNILNTYIIEKDEYPKIKFLMIQRKDTMGFIDFMRGKYNEEDKESKLEIYFNEMTFDEKKMLKEYDFDAIWGYLWNKGSRVYKQEYEKAKDKFNKIDISKYLQKSTKTFLHSEFGFPKGRREVNETNIECAEREFTEETGFKKEHYDFIYDYPMIEETFIGTNNIKYKHLYYVVKMKIDAPQPRVNFYNKIQVGEVRNVGWFSIKECLELMRSYDIEKKKVIKKLYNDLITLKTFNVSKYYRTSLSFKKQYDKFPEFIKHKQVPITINKLSYREVLRKSL